MMITRSSKLAPTIMMMMMALPYPGTCSGECNGQDAAAEDVLLDLYFTVHFKRGLNDGLSWVAGREVGCGCGANTQCDYRNCLKKRY